MTAHKITWFNHDTPITYADDQQIIDRLLYIMRTKPLNEIRTRATHFRLYDEATPDDFILAQDVQPSDTLTFPQHIITHQISVKTSQLTKLKKPLTLQYPYGPEETPLIKQP